MTKVIVNLPDSTVESWKHAAAQHGLTMTEMLTHMIHTHQFLRQKICEGNSILILSPDRTYRRVLFS